MLRWKFTSCTFPAASLGNNPTIKLHLDVRLKPGIAPGTSVFNRADILSGNGSLQPMLCDIGSLPDVQDLDGDGDVTESTCSVASTDTWIVPKLATVDATKWVNGAADQPGVFSRFPNVGSTSVASDGRATYHLFIDMRGNITASRIQLIDILPYIGDTSALSATVARKSGWTEELDGPVEVAFIDRSSADTAKSPQAQDEVLWQPVTAGLALKYSSSTNPCRLTTALLGQMHLDGSSYPKGCTQNPWDLTDPVGARAFGMDMSVALDPFNPGNGHGDMLRLTVTVKDINDVPTADDADKVAWNSFAYTVTDTDGYEFLSAEPIKVGVAMRSESPPPPPAEFVPLAVGDVVWWDHDHDGVQDAGEPPISGVNVVLYDGAGAQAVDANGRPVAPVVTDAAGHYVFDNLRRGNYQVRFGVVAGAVPTRTAAGGDRLADSNPDGAGLTPVFALDGRSPETRLPIASDGTTVAELIDPSVDAGFWIPMAIGDEVWLDGYRNGRRDAGESPVARVTLALLNADGSPANDADGVPVPWAVTNEAGRYLFDNLLAGDYRVRFTLPPRYEWTLPRVETDVGVDSNPDDDGLTPVFQLSPGSPQVRPGTPEDGTTHLIDPTIDAGIWLPAVPTVILPETA